jgi:hypothetical protein
MLSPKEGLPNLFFNKKLEKSFTKEGHVLDLKVIYPKFPLIFGTANYTPLSQSIFVFLLSPCEKNLNRK